MFHNKSIDDVKLICLIAITNVGNISEIAERMALYTYTADKMMEGQQLHDQLEQLISMQIAHKADKQALTNTLHHARATAQAAYIRVVKLARIAFQGQVEPWKTLGLEGSRAVGMAEMLAQARRFYTNALNDADILAALQRYHVTEADLLQGLALLAAVDTASAAREKAHGLALQTTQTRDETLQKLKAWVSDMFAVARVALEDRPDLLYALGLPLRP